MDMSKKYIEQCKVAKEIQNIWKPDYGDFYIYLSEILIIGTRPKKELISERPLPLPFFWIPRQDQLQAIIWPEYVIFGCDAIEHFMDDFHAFQDENNPLFDSMEELTLAFVMHCSHSKRWNGKEWAQI